jgi:hypothetical protein
MAGRLPSPTQTITSGLTRWFEGDRPRLFAVAFADEKFNNHERHDSVPVLSVETVLTDRVTQRGEAELSPAKEHRAAARPSLLWPLVVAGLLSEHFDQAEVGE